MSHIHQIKCDVCEKSYSQHLLLAELRVAAKGEFIDSYLDPHHVCRTCVMEQPIAVCGLIAALYIEAEKANVQ